MRYICICTNFKTIWNSMIRRKKWMFYTLKEISNRNENVYKCDYVLPVFDNWVNVKLQSLFLEDVGLI